MAKVHIAFWQGELKIARFENVRFHKNYKLLTVTCTSNFNKHENNEAWLYRPRK
jgi:hypothetical protein